MTDAQLLDAITSLLGVLRQQREHACSAEQRRIHVIRTMTERVRSSAEAEIGALRSRVQACLLPNDPLRQTWSVFRMLGVEYDEARWTQWFAALLRAENGARCSRIAWRAFCEAVAHRASLLPPSGASNPADHHHWRDVVAHEIPSVEDEVPQRGLGRLDLLFTTPSIVAAVENKLWADWSDGARAPQADRYRDIAQSRLMGDPRRRLGLVLLSQRSGLRPGDYPSDYIHVSWRDVGRSLRRALRREGSTSDQAIRDLWPIVLTLVSIEQDLLGLSLSPDADHSPSAQLTALSELATYLEGT